ncbi:hypothetical protein COCNU_scaffold000525G000100 [Cocos nucifera]|nr:hypothetical protein [Cocos nucifera]
MSASGMHLSLGIFKHEVRQFATQKRMAPSTSSLCTSKKSRAVGPLATPASADAQLVALSGVVGALVVALHAPPVAASSEAPSTITQSEEDVIIVNALTIALSSIAQTTIATSAPRSSSIRRGRSLSPSMPESMSVPPEHSSAGRKGKAPISSALTGSDVSNRGYTDSKQIDVQVPKCRSALSDPQLARNMVHAILLSSDQELKRRRTLGKMFGSVYPTFIGLFPDLDLSSIVIPGTEEEKEGGDGAKEEEEGGDDRSFVGLVDDGAPITVLASTVLAISAVPVASVEGTSSPSTPMSLASQLAAKVPSKNEGAAPTNVILPTDITPIIETEAILDQPSKQSIVE